MGKCISLGEYNKLYKYIWIFLIVRSIVIIKNEIYYEPYSPFISPQLYYIFYIIISIILLIIKKCRKKKKSNNENIEEILIYNKQDIETEYGILVNDYFLFINFIFVVTVHLVQDLIYMLNLPMFNYWMFQMFFYELFHSRLFKTKIYKHHIVSLIFILSSCSIINTIIIIISFTNETEDAKFFDNRKWLIPIGFTSFLLFNIFKAYTCCNEKYYL